MTTAIDPSHWAVQGGVLASFRELPQAVAVCHVRLPFASRNAASDTTTTTKTTTTPVGVSLNPTDSTNYRLLFRILVEDTRDLKLNEFPYTAQDSAILGIAVAIVGELVGQKGLYLQTMQLGNNSQSYQDGVLVFGNEREPYFLHQHGLLRGDPSQHYLGSDLPPLGGPPVGTAIQPQKDQKRPWDSPETMKRAAECVRDLLLKSAKAMTLQEMYTMEFL